MFYHTTTKTTCDVKVSKNAQVRFNCFNSISLGGYNIIINYVLRNKKIGTLI